MSPDTEQRPPASLMAVVGAALAIAVALVAVVAWWATSPVLPADEPAATTGPVPVPTWHTAAPLPPGRTVVLTAVPITIPRSPIR